MTDTTNVLADNDDFETVATRLPPHPGESLRKEFFVALKLTVGKLAKAFGIGRSRPEHVAAEKMGISGDTALWLGRVFGTGPELWMNLQSRYEIAKAQVVAGADVERLTPFERA